MCPHLCHHIYHIYFQRREGQMQCDLACVTLLGCIATTEGLCQGARYAPGTQCEHANQHSTCGMVWGTALDQDRTLVQWCCVVTDTHTIPASFAGRSGWRLCSLPNAICGNEQTSSTHAKHEPITHPHIYMWLVHTPENSGLQPCAVQDVHDM